MVGFLAGIIRLDYLHIALEVFCGATFLLMIYGDNELRRLMYFAAYCVYVIIVTSIRTVFLIWDRDERVAAIKLCKNLSDMVSDGKITGWEVTGYKDIVDCKTSVDHFQHWAALGLTLIGLIMQIHFCLVLFTHYKNANLTKENGGC